MTNISYQNANLDSVQEIFILSQPFVKRSILLSKSIKHIERDLDHTFIAYDNVAKIVAGTVCSIKFSSSLYEVRNLVVHPRYQNLHIGTQLIHTIEKHLKTTIPFTNGSIKLFALTYASKFFYRIGYLYTPKEDLPEKVYTESVIRARKNSCQEIGVYKNLLLK